MPHLTVFAFVILLPLELRDVAKRVEPRQYVKESGICYTHAQ